MVAGVRRRALFALPGSGRVRGISSGSMAHFGAILSKEQIDAIIKYERNL